MQIEPLGDSALIVRVVDEFARDSEASLSAVLETFRSLEAASIPGVIELAPAYTTVAVFLIRHKLRQMKLVSRHSIGSDQKSRAS